MLRLFLFLTLIFTSHAQAINDCKWEDDTPCVVISKGINNSNAIGDNVSPTISITKSDIEKYNLIDLNKVLNHIQGVDVT